MINSGARQFIKRLTSTMSMSSETRVHNRKLLPGDDVFSENKWSDIEWTQEMEIEAEAKIQKQIEQPCRLMDRHQLEARVREKWDKFYREQGLKAFKDRRWILKDFPEIEGRLRPESGPCNILELGCGIGSSITHILENNQNPQLHLYCCDISNTALEFLKTRDYYPPNSNKITVFQADIANEFEEPVRLKTRPESMDFINAIFTFSSMSPEKIKDATNNLVHYLKPGGMFLLRDYTRCDRNQLRFGPGAYISENYYLKADGTTQFFPTTKFVDEVFSGAGMEKVSLETDNNLVVNRKECVKIYRRWIRAKYRKPF